MSTKTLVLIPALFISSILFSQTQFGRISGKVFDKETTSGLSGVTVYLYDGESLKQSARTNAGGNFSFVNVEQGSFILKVSKSGFDDYNKRVMVNPNFTTKLVVPMVSLNSVSESRPTIVAAEPKPAPQNVAVKEAKPKQVAEPAVAVKTDTKTVADIQKNGNSAKMDSQTVVAKSTNPVIEDAEAVQEASSTTNEPDFDVIPQVAAEPITGWNALWKSIKFPEIARKQKIEGRVLLQAWVDTNGDVTAIAFVKKVNPAIDQACEEAIYATKFKPGTIDGVPVNSKIGIPINFKL